MTPPLRSRPPAGCRRRADAGFTIIEVAMAGFVMDLYGIEGDIS